MAKDDDGLLLGIGARFYRNGGQLFVERQTVSGLRAWRQNFSRVTAFSICNDKAPPEGWVPWNASEQPEGIALEPLPDSYRPKVLLRQQRRLAARFLELMRQHRYRNFAYGGWIGDPGEIAASTARRHGLPHALWFDRVESQVSLAGHGANGKVPLKARLRAAILRRNETRAVRGASLNLLHGATVFEHFRKIATNPQKVEDIHFTNDDLITDSELLTKAAAAEEGPLSIVYCGRAVAMKGPGDWIAVLVGLKQRGVAFHARWLGDGDRLEQMKRAAAAGGLGPEDVVFEGFVADPARVRDAYRGAQVMLFCHLTDESPRNLIESLHSGTPVVGYSDPYSRDLVAEQTAGILVPRGDVAALTEAVAGLAGDRVRLADLIVRAGRSARHLTRDQVFRHRSDIIRTHLHQPHNDHSQRG